jgi:hypothetical protein
MSPGNFRLDWPCQIRCVSLQLIDRIIFKTILRYAVRIKGEFVDVAPPPQCFKRKWRLVSLAPERSLKAQRAAPISADSLGQSRVIRAAALIAWQNIDQLVGFAWWRLGRRTPGHPPFSSMNSMPADFARRMT